MTPRIPQRLMRASLWLAGPLFATDRVSLAGRRRAADALSGRVRAPRGSGLSEQTVNGVPGTWVVPLGADAQTTVLYAHGGGFVVGAAAAYAGFAGQIAARLGGRAFVVDYRLAPEHPHPAALDDLVAAYQGLIADGVDPSHLLVAGDSAGGGLALALAMVVRDRGLPAPAGVGLICPWLDLAPDVSGARPAVGGPLLTADLLRQWATSYIADGDPLDPRISPLRGDLEGLSPLVLHYAGDDLLATDGWRLVERAAAEEIALRHRRFDGLWHAFHLQVGLLGAADRAVEEFARALGDLIRTV